MPLDAAATYGCVARDPRDVAISWDQHWANLDKDAFKAARAAAVGLQALAELGAPLAPVAADPSSASGSGPKVTPASSRGPT